MRKTSLDQVYELAKKNEKIFFIGSDLGVGTLKKFKEEMPNRFFMEGISEQNIIGMAAGLALEGKIVYVNTIATFLTRRCFEQIVLDVCLHKLNVRLIGNGGGLVYAPLGPTHTAIDDIAILRTIPNMTILAPADADEMRVLMEETANYSGPIYIRVAKGGDPLITSALADKMKISTKIGKGLLLKQGRDALLITTGVMLNVAMEASEQLIRKNIDVSILHMPTVKPLDISSLMELMGVAPIIITIEEGVIYGGLGSAVAEVLAEANFGKTKQFQRIGLKDTFPEFYGNQNELLQKYQISSQYIVEKVTGMYLSQPHFTSHSP